MKIQSRTHSQSLLVLHLIVFIWGFTGILGRLISVSALNLVWWRVLIAALALGVFAVVGRKKIAVTFNEFIQLFLVGVLTAGHWLCFFSSIKLSNISVALAVISTTSFFVAVVSPLIRREKFLLYELLLGLVVVFGLYLIFHFEAQYTIGIILSLAAALLAALFSSFNSLLIRKHHAVKIAFWEMLSAVIAISIYLFFDSGTDWATLLQPGWHDLIYLLLLGILCTAVAFVVSVDVMKVLSPFTVALAVNMEPVYTIALAMLFFGESEIMSPQFYLGTFVLISTLFIESWIKKRYSESK